MVFPSWQYKISDVKTVRTLYKLKYFTNQFILKFKYYLIFSDTIYSFPCLCILMYIYQIIIVLVDKISIITYRYNFIQLVVRFIKNLIIILVLPIVILLVYV
jgi:hypothetical protein